MKESIVIACFPGVGAKELYDKLGPERVSLNKIEPFYTTINENGSKIDNPNFAKDYVEHIQSLIGIDETILVSAHPVVLKELIDAKVGFVLVYPDRSLKDEYMERYKQAGEDEEFLGIMNDNWNRFIDDMEHAENVVTYRLAGPNLYLEDTKMWVNLVYARVEPPIEEDK